MPITPRLKWLYLSKETVKQMRWHKEGKRYSEDLDIMLHPVDTEAWEALDRTALIQNLQGTLGVSALGCRRMVSNLTMRPVVCILAGQFS
jgi:hypothetical protein